MDLKTLPALTVLSDNVTIVEVDQIKIVRVIHDKATAGISLHGGHVVSFTPEGQEDLIWMSEKAKNVQSVIEGDYHHAILGHIGSVQSFFRAFTNQQPSTVYIEQHRKF